MSVQGMKGRLGKWSVPGFWVSGRRWPRPGGRVVATGAGDHRRRRDYSRIDVIAVVEREGDIQLRPKTRRGEYCGRCPFPGCASRDDAFLVWERGELDERPDGTREKHFWCRRCGRSGDVVSFVFQLAEARGHPISWREAARRVGLLEEEGEGNGEPAGVERGAERRARKKKVDEEFMALLGIYERAKAALLGADSQGREYLEWRGISVALAQQWGLGYIPPASEEVGEAFRRQWSGRILFPLYSWDGRISGFKGRAIAFWRSASNPLEQRRRIEEWNKSQSHQGATIIPYLSCGTGTFGSPNIQEAESLICCEGEFDALAFLAAGIGPVRATGKHPVGALPPAVVKVVLALDRDVEQEEIRGLARELIRSGLEIEILRPPIQHKDFADVWAARQRQRLSQMREEGEQVAPLGQVEAAVDLPTSLKVLIQEWPEADIEIEYEGQVVWRGEAEGGTVAPAPAPLPAEDRCARHGRRIVYRDRKEQGYCPDPDCFSRPRLLEAGRRLGWPELREEIPTNGRFPGWQREIVGQGENAWQEFCARAEYELIDAALREVRRRGQELPLLAEMFHEE